MIDYQEIGDVISEKKNKNIITVDPGVGTIAEYFEFLDGNPNNEDRLGISVVIEDGKVRQALKGEKPIGVVCRSAVIIGSTENYMNGKYIRDEYGRIQTTLMEVYVYAVPNTITNTGSTKIELYPVGQVPEGIIVQDQNKTTIEIPQINPFYDETKVSNLIGNSIKYACVCIFGKVPIKTGQIINSNWVKIRSYTTVDEYVVK